jgi:hypothetical protein
LRPPLLELLGSFHPGLEAIGTCSAANAPAVKHFGAVPIDYRAGDFVARVGGRSMRGDSVAGSRMLPISPLIAELERTGSLENWRTPDDAHTDPNRP